MAYKKEMMVLGAAVAGAASNYLYGKMKPIDEVGKNSGNPALSESKMRDPPAPATPEIKKDKPSGTPTSEPKPQASAVKESDIKKLDDKTAKDALDVIKSPEVKKENPGRKAGKESQKKNSD